MREGPKKFREQRHDLLFLPLHSGALSAWLCNADQPHQKAIQTTTGPRPRAGPPTACVAVRESVKWDMQGKGTGSSRKGKGKASGSPGAGGS